MKTVMVLLSLVMTVCAAPTLAGNPRDLSDYSAYSATLLLLKDGNVLITGGRSACPQAVNNSAELYNPLNGK